MKKSKISKVIAFVLALTLIVGVFALPASALIPTPRCGSCGSSNVGRYQTGNYRVNYVTSCTHGYGSSDEVGTRDVQFKCYSCQWSKWYYNEPYTRCVASGTIYSDNGEVA